MVPTEKEWRKALAERHGGALQRKFSSAAVAVCGLGGLGSNIAVSIARAGVGRLTLIDFDPVDLTNLHRQQYKADQIGRYKAEALRENLKEAAPYAELEIHTERITEANAAELLTCTDVICEAFDDAESKAMLTNTVLETTAKTVLRAKEAFEQGADYLGVGAVYPTTTKVKTVLTSIDTLRELCSAVPIPVNAIGGLNRDNLDVLVGIPIAGICAVSRHHEGGRPGTGGSQAENKGRRTWSVQKR